MTRFNTQPPKGGWNLRLTSSWAYGKVSTHSRLKAAGGEAQRNISELLVSTHSRLKAAGRYTAKPRRCKWRFNTQPPKGGWSSLFFRDSTVFCFNTQPPKGGWATVCTGTVHEISFNTQPPKGGWNLLALHGFRCGCFNTQPPKGGWMAQVWGQTGDGVSTHSRLKAAGKLCLMTF